MSGKPCPLGPNHHRRHHRLAAIWGATEWTGVAARVSGAARKPVVRAGRLAGLYPPTFFWWWYPTTPMRLVSSLKERSSPRPAASSPSPPPLLMSIIRSREAKQCRDLRLRALGFDDRGNPQAPACSVPDGVLLGKYRAGTICAMTARSMSCASRRPDRARASASSVPTLLTWPGSVHRSRHQGRELDPDGGLSLRAMAACCLFDPTNARSSAYNPLLEVRQGEWEVRDVQNIADILVDPEGSAGQAQSLGKNLPFAAGRRDSCTSFTPSPTRPWPASPTSSPIRAAPSKRPCAP